MKHLTNLLIALLMSTTLSAQMGSSECKDREYGGPSIKMTKFNSKSSVVMGGFGGWFLTKNLAIGGAGYGLVSSYKVPDQAVTKDTELQFGYGGFMIAYEEPVSDIITLSGNLLIGGGQFTFDNNREGISSEDEVFILEPTLELSVKTFDFLKIGVAGNYRYIYGIDTPGLSDSKMSGVSAQLNFTFGEF